MSNKLKGQCREIFMAFLNMYGDTLAKQGTYSIHYSADIFLLNPITGQQMCQL
jgi:hypothetical protein